MQALSICLMCGCCVYWSWGVVRVVTPTNNPASRLIHHEWRACTAGRQGRTERDAVRRDGRGHHRHRDCAGLRETALLGKEKLGLFMLFGTEQRNYTDGCWRFFSLGIVCTGILGLSTRFWFDNCWAKIFLMLKYFCCAWRRDCRLTEMRVARGWQGCGKSWQSVAILANSAPATSDGRQFCIMNTIWINANENKTGGKVIVKLIMREHNIDVNSINEVSRANMSYAYVYI